MTIQTQFRIFNDKIRLKSTDARLKLARQKRDSIDKEIKGKFKEKDWGEVTTFLQGSYATDMAIVPIDEDYDVDVAVLMPKEDSPDSPVAPKNEILKVLEARGLSNAKIKRPCVTAQYMVNGKPKFHIDYPVYRVDSLANHEIAWGKPSSDAKDKKWSSGDPKGLVEWSKHSNLQDDARAQYRCLVRYLKRWRDLRFSQSEVKPFSIGLTIMVRECFVESFSTDGDSDDLEALIRTIENILNRGYFRPLGEDKYDVVVDLPTSPYVDVFKDKGSGMGTRLRNRLIQLKNRLLRAQEKSTVKAASNILAESHVFGFDFPIPDDGGGGKSTARKVSVTAGAVGSPQGA